MTEELTGLGQETVQIDNMILNRPLYTDTAPMHGYCGYLG
jgi:hypothetical protein